MLVFPLVYIVRKFEKEKEDKTMTHNIIAFKSGFYGIQISSTGEIWRSDLIKWDGKKGTNYPYDTSETFDFYIDAQNTVYYVPQNDISISVWCSGRNLNAHCHT